MGEVYQEIELPSLQLLQRGKHAETHWINGYIEDLAVKIDVSIFLNPRAGSDHLANRKTITGGAPQSPEHLLLSGC